jgi:hypothetical protein
MTLPSHKRLVIAAFFVSISTPKIFIKNRNQIIDVRFFALYQSIIQQQGYVRIVLGKTRVKTEK